MRRKSKSNTVETPEAITPNGQICWSGTRSGHMEVRMCHNFSNFSKALRSVAGLYRVVLACSIKTLKESKLTHDSLFRTSLGQFSGTIALVLYFYSFDWLKISNATFLNQSKQIVTCTRSFSRFLRRGTRFDDGDGNEIIKKTIGLIS